MIKRKLGTQGLEVSALGLGCMGMSQSYGPADDAESISAIHRALDVGINFFDTAEVYGPFKNELLLGKALKGKRKDVIIATKFGFHIEDGVATGLNSHPKHIRKTVDESLSRLQTDYIDVLYQHRVDKRVPIEDVVGVMGELVLAGKVRYLGLSEAGVDTITRAHRTFALSCVQSEYSLWEKNLEAEIIPHMRKLGIGLVPFSPLGRGFLTGTAQSAETYPQNDHRRQRDPRFQPENFNKNMAAAQAVFVIAKELEATPAQVAIAWLLHKGDDIVPIPGTKKSKYVEENAKATELSLSPKVMTQLNDALEQTAGARYDEQLISQINR